MVLRVLINSRFYVRFSSLIYSSISCTMQQKSSLEWVLLGLLFLLYDYLFFYSYFGLNWKCCQLCHRIFSFPLSSPSSSYLNDDVVCLSGALFPCSSKFRVLKLHVLKESAGLQHCWYIVRFTDPPGNLGFVHGFVTMIIVSVKCAVEGHSWYCVTL